MSRIGPVFAGFLLVAMLMLLPLRLGLAAADMDDAGLAARAVTGNIWSGRLAAARWRGVPLGDVEAGVAPLALLGTGLRIELRGAQLRGAVERGPGGGGIAGASGRIGPLSIGGQTLQSVDLEGVDIGFSDGQCRSAAGRLTVQPTGLLASAGSLTGVPRCDGRFVMVPLASTGGETRIDLRLAGDGGYRAQIAVEPADEATRAGLLAAGFAPAPQGVALTVEGVL